VIGLQGSSHSQKEQRMAQQPAGYSGTPLVRKLGIKADTRARRRKA
jgi:hypothetical protein